MKKKSGQPIVEIIFDKDERVRKFKMNDKEVFIKSFTYEQDVTDLPKMTITFYPQHVIFNFDKNKIIDKFFKKINTKVLSDYDKIKNEFKVSKVLLKARRKKYV